MRLNSSLAIVSIALTLFCTARSTNAAPSDPCSLLTPDQISAVIGSTVEAGKAVGTKMCQWLVPNQPTGLKVAVTLQDSRAFAYAKTPVNDSRITKTPVPGVGDEAIQGTALGKVTTLTVKKGDTVFVVHVTGIPVDQAQSMEKSLALQILPKL